MEPGLDMSEGGKVWLECWPLGKDEEEEECTLEGESQLASRSLGDLGRYRSLPWCSAFSEREWLLEFMETLAGLEVVCDLCSCLLDFLVLLLLLLKSRSCRWPLPLEPLRWLLLWLLCRPELERLWDLDEDEAEVPEAGPTGVHLLPWLWLPPPRVSPYIDLSSEEDEPEALGISLDTGGSPMVSFISS